MSDRKIPTNSLLTSAKRAAKKSTTPDRTYTQALDEQALLAGYPDWRTLAMANGLRNAHECDDIPLDPVLPRNFDNTPNEERSKKVLDQFWERPFMLSRSDGTFEVRALDGGAWDRSTWYGMADTVEEARVLAKRKLSEWIALISEPVVYMRPDGLVDLVTMPRRPDQEMKVLASRIRPEDVETERSKLKSKHEQTTKQDRNSV